MEIFNKNWLLILLTAVVFGILGYLLGRSSGCRGDRCGYADREHRIMWKHKDGHSNHDVKVKVEIDTVYSSEEEKGN